MLGFLYTPVIIPILQMRVKASKYLLIGSSVYLYAQALRLGPLKFVLLIY